MKKILFFSGLKLFVIGILFIAESYGQSFSATWALTVDTAVIVAGNIIAPGQVLSNTPIATDTITVKDYTGGAAVGVAERLWLNGVLWPTETSKNSGRYIQYSVSPFPGNMLTIQTVTLNIGGYGSTANLMASISYSTDSTFAVSTQLSAPIILPDIRTNPFTALACTPSKLVNSGKTFYVRIYPWFTTTPSATKYICLTNVVISGITGAIGAPSLTVTPTSLSFGSAKDSTSKDKSFSISGTNLVPTNGNITIPSPTNFAASTANGSGYSSIITVPYTGGIRSDTTIYARFTPTTVTSYNDSILISGGGALTQKVTVTGTGIAAETILGIFVSTTGSDTNAGSFDKPFATIAKAISVAQVGDTVFIRGGRYSLGSTIGISSSGIDNSRRRYVFAYGSERPVLDFSSLAYGSSNRGINLIGNYWHIKGLDIYKAGDNGMNISGSHNIVEFCALYENQDAGLQLSSGASNNRIIYCDSYFNYDSPNGGGNADGFSPKLDVGTGNYFYGCRSWQNSDDGWDGYVRPAVPVAGKDTMKTIIENCWCFSNGYLKNGIAGTGNGNGFKMGGGDKINGVSNGDSLRHNMTLIYCLSFNNLAKGFDQNNNRGTMTLINCSGYANGSYNFSVPGFIRVGETLAVKNCISLASSGVMLSSVPNPILATNSWMALFASVTSLDFISIDTSGVRGQRKADGSLPDVTFMHLAQGSQFINTGTYVGLPFNGHAPDLGCFESDYVTGVANKDEVRLADFQLLQNYPNPFNPTTKINYQLPASSFISLKIYDILGREIITLVNEEQAAGLHAVQWNGNNSTGLKVGSGVYFYQLKGSTGFGSSKKMTVLE